jgi:F-type H+-transporting ATPase subunit b
MDKGTIGMNTYIFAAENQGLFQALGLNLKSFILNGVAFLVVVVILKRFVYPSLIKAIDGRMADMTAVDALKAEAQKQLDKASEESAKLVADRKASHDIILATKNESGEMLEEARTKAETQAQRIIAESHEQLARDVEAARMVLKKDIAKLVTAATEVVIDEKLDKASDKALIERSLVSK